MFLAALAVLPVVVAWLFLPQLSDAFRIKNHVVSLGGCLLLCSWLMRGPVTVLRFPWVVRLALLALVVTVIVSNLAAPQPVVAWRMALEYLPLGFLLCLIAHQENAQRTAESLESGWLAAAAGVALVALQQTFLPGWFDLGFVAPGKMAAFSTLGNPIWASMVMVVALPLAVRRSMAGPRIFWALPAVLAVALWATQSRQAWLAVAAMAWIAVVWLGGRHWRLLALGALAVLLAATVFSDFSAGAFHSLKGRLLIMAGAWEMLADHPLTGVGLGHVGPSYPAYQAKLLALPGWENYAEHAAVIEDAHNEYLQWGATAGLAGFAGFTLLCGAITWMGWHSPSVRRGQWHWYLGYWGLLVTLLFTGIQPQSSLTLLLVCCQAVLLASALSDRPRYPLHHSAAFCWVGIAVLAGALALHWAWQDIRASCLEGQGDRLMQERDAWLAGQTYKEALSIDGDRGPLLRKHASILYLDGRYLEALDALAMARRYTGDTGASLLEAEILATLGRDREAIVAYQAIVASFPQLLSPHFILGQLFVRQRQYASARDEFRRVVDMQPAAHNLQLTVEKIAQQKDMARVFLEIVERQ